MHAELHTEQSVLSPKYTAGPHGVGDPTDKSLRKVETEVMIPKLMREKAKTEKCADLVQQFRDCCAESSLLLVVKCRDENNRMKECLTKWYQDEGFKNECTEEYLRLRSEYRATGIKKSLKRM